VADALLADAKPRPNACQAEAEHPRVNPQMAMMELKRLIERLLLPLFYGT